MQIKLLKKGLKVDGKYFPCWYSNSAHAKDGEHATIYIKTYDRLPEGLDKELQVENDTEIQTDYVMRDKIRIPKSSKYFALVESLAV